MAEITICKLNNSYGYLLTDNLSLFKELHEALSFWVPGYQFMPQYKSGWFDGKIRLMDFNTRQFPLGLAEHIYEYCKSRNIPCDVENAVLECFTPSGNAEEILDFISSKRVFSKMQEITPTEYQLEAVVRAIQRKRCVNICPTSFGKSLAITLECIYWINSGKKCLIVVPTKDLVDQFASDIRDYATNEQGRLEEWFPSIQKIYSGKKKQLDVTTDICISTWQSLAKIEDAEEYMNQFDVIVLDECFDGDSRVLTPKGYKKIKDIQAGDKVINFDEKTGNFKEDEVVEVHKNLTHSFSEKMYELVFDTGVKIKVTGNHKFLTQRGWVRADELTEEDEIVNRHTRSEARMVSPEEKVNVLLEYYKQTIRITSYSKHCMKFNNGVVITDEARIRSIYTRFVKKNDLVWYQRADEWLFNSEIEQEIHIAQKVRGGRNTLEKYGIERLRQYAIGRVPWNKGKKMDGYESIHRPRTEEEKRKMSLSKMGEKNAMYGVRYSEEYKRESSKRMKEKIAKRRIYTKYKQPLYSF